MLPWGLFETRVRRYANGGFLESWRSGSPHLKGQILHFLIDTLRRISSLSQQSGRRVFDAESTFTTYSIDVSHAIHPNYVDKYDPRIKSELGSGVCVKMNALEKYASMVTCCGHFLMNWRRKKFPHACRFTNGYFLHDRPLDHFMHRRQNSNDRHRIPIFGHACCRRNLWIADYEGARRSTSNLTTGESPPEPQRGHISLGQDRSVRFTVQPVASTK